MRLIRNNHPSQVSVHEVHPALRPPLARSCSVPGHRHRTAGQGRLQFGVKDRQLLGPLPLGQILDPRLRRADPGRRAVGVVAGQCVVQVGGLRAARRQPGQASGALLLHRLLIDPRVERSDQR